MIARKPTFNSEHLLQLRTDKGLKKIELEIEADLSTGHIVALEKGKIKDPAVTIVYRIAKYFRVPIEEFIIEK